MSLLEELPQWFKTRPLVLLRFPEGYEEAILESKRGLARFTFAAPHSVFDGLKGLLQGTTE